MSDLHRLPLLGHDLPEPVAPKATTRVQVFKEEDRRAWSHPQRRGLFSFCTGPYRHASHQLALEAAIKHLKWCCS